MDNNNRLVLTFNDWMAIKHCVNRAIRDNERQIEKLTESIRLSTESQDGEAQNLQSIKNELEVELETFKSIHTRLSSRLS